MRPAIEDGRADGDEAGQVLIIGPQSVNDPGTHARAHLRFVAGVQLEHGLAVRLAIGVHAADEAQLIRVFRHFWKRSTDLQAAFAVRCEFPGRREKLAVRRNQIAGARRHGFAVIAGEERFVIECIDGGWTAVHEEEDDAFGARGIGRLLRGERTGRRQGRRHGFSEQAAQGDGTEAATNAAQHFTSGEMR